MEARHPRMLPILLPDILLEIMQRNASNSVAQFVDLRLEWFKVWSARAKALAPEDLLKYYGYPDPEVVSL